MPGENWADIQGRGIQFLRLKMFPSDCAGVGGRISPPPENPFPPEEIYGSYDSKSLPLERISYEKYSPLGNLFFFPGGKRFTGLKCPVKVFRGEDFY